VLVQGSSVLSGDPRFDDVLFDRCPLALVGHPDCPDPGARQEWLGEVFDAFNWQQSGASIRDVVPEPSQALIDAVLHVRRERDALSARRRRDRDRERGR